MLRHIVIERLGRENVGELAGLLAAATDADRRYFTPFAYDVESLDAVIRRMDRDCMYGVWLEGRNQPNELAGFYMMRGLDEGFASPMYGVFVHPAMRRAGIASLTLRHAMTLCKVNRLPSLLLKVYPDNLAAFRAYEAMGFKVVREEPPQRVMQLGLAA